MIKKKKGTTAYDALLCVCFNVLFLLVDVVSQSYFLQWNHSFLTDAFCFSLHNTHIFFFFLHLLFPTCLCFSNLTNVFLCLSFFFFIRSLLFLFSQQLCNIGCLQK